MNSLLEHEIKDLLNAEKQLTKALPKMAKAARDPELKKAFESHLEETKEHVSRLESICEELGIGTRGEKCEAMEGLIKEGSELIEAEDADPAIRDAALIAAAQRVEHYEMAGYGAARSFAELLGHDNVVKTLQQTLNEEGEADKKLTKIARSTVNPKASSGVEQSSRR